jgi:membrane protease YdiL (CAAX protease family)
MNTSTVMTVVYVSLAAIFLIVSGLKRQPGIGIILSFVLIGIAIWQKEISLAQIGFSSPGNWPATLLLGLLLGIVLSVVSIMLVEPIVERFTKQPHDVSIVGNVRGNWKALLSWLVLIWVVVAFVEETLYRGFLMNEITRLLGTGSLALFLNILFCSIVFGLSHSYQGRSGAWSTGIIGALIGVVFICNGFNLWLPIFVHGFIDTVALGLMSVGTDKWLKRLIWEKPGSVEH